MVRGTAVVQTEEGEERLRFDPQDRNQYLRVKKHVGCYVRVTGKFTLDDEERTTPVRLESIRHLPVRPGPLPDRMDAWDEILEGRQGVCMDCINGEMMEQEP